MSVNKAIVIGNLGGNPQVRALPTPVRTSRISNS